MYFRENHEIYGTTKIYNDRTGSFLEGIYSLQTEKNKFFFLLFFCLVVCTDSNLEEVV